VQLLDPLEVDAGRHADEQVGVPGDVVLPRVDRAVEALVEQQVRSLADLLPGSERAGLATVLRSLLGVVDV